MGKLIFITGGARSGKSSFAEKKAKELKEPVVYVATGIAFDNEMKERIALHQQQRPSSWHTLEAYRDITDKLIATQDEFGVILLDCVTIMVNNIMMDIIKDWDHISMEDCVAVETTAILEISLLIDYMKKSDKVVIVVTNETGSGIVPLYASSRLFRDVAGRVNQILAKEAEEAYLLVSSIPVRIK